MSDERLLELPSGVTLCWDSFGSPSGRPLLLVAGLGMQLLSFHEDLCEALAAHDLRVVRFDNRDVGRSSRWPSPPPTTWNLLVRRFPQGQYDLGDMADDTAGLVEALELGPAHVVGVSMGGMIAQTLAARRPELVRSLVSIISSTGSRRVGQPARSTVLRMLKRPARTREEAIERAAAFFRHIGATGFPGGEDELRAEAARAFDRAHDPAGSARQLAAILRSGDRTAELRRIAAATLVVHGDRDLMVHPSGGRATADAIPGARHVTIPGLGHDVPRGAWPQLVRLIVEHVDAVDRRV